MPPLVRIGARESDTVYSLNAAPRPSTEASWKTSQGPAKSIIVAPSVRTNATAIGPFGGVSSAAASSAAIMRRSSRASQRDHRVHFRGAARGQQARKRADRGQHRGDEHEGDRIVRGDPEDEPGHHARDGQTAENAEREPHAYERHALPHDHRQDGPGLGAEREADADLLRALADRVRDHAGDARRRDAESEEREGAEQQRGE